VRVRSGPLEIVPVRDVHQALEALGIVRPASVR
jgi:hypothetical protein